MARSAARTRRRATGASLAALAAPLLLSGCGATDVPLPARAAVDLAPARRESPADRIEVARSAAPMYRELLPIDLVSAARVALAGNDELELARARVAQREGEASRAAGALVPVLSPGLAFEKVDGAVRATAGNAIDASFVTWSPFLLAELVVNPGKASWELVAARKRLLAAKHAERAQQVETLRRAALDYHALLLAQVRVDAARRSVAEARELLRITQARARAGTAVQADERTAQAEVARREQDLILALRAFEESSIGLAVTLDLDPAVTLAPSEERVELRTLVRDDVGIDELLAIAVEQRDDLAAVRALYDASSASSRAARWSAFGPTAALGARYGGIRGSAEDVEGLGDVSYALHDQLRLGAAGSAQLSWSSLGDVEVADAIGRQAGVAAARSLLAVRAQVVAADRDRRAQRELVPLARDEVAAADEALRLARRQLEIGTLTALDVLQRESAAARARVAHATALVRHNQSQIDLLAALGVLDLAALAASDDSSLPR
jgi:outer membrane protein TolC